MLSKTLLLAIAAAPLVAAHGKVAVVQGDAGGNGTALGIMGAVVPGPGKNKVTETDTTTFGGKINIATDGLGKTTGNGANKADMISMAMAQSGSTLPQVSSSGGSLSGTFHIVTSDGGGPLKAVVDPTAQGAFSQGTEATVSTQVPGNNGNVRKTEKRWWARVLQSAGIMKRATNINEDYPVKVEIPAGTTCTGTAGGVSNVCFLKLANSNPAGPFGGIIPFQMAGAGGNASDASDASAATAGKTRRAFSA
jgi:hypothetical protein